MAELEMCTDMAALPCLDAGKTASFCSVAVLSLALLSCVGAASFIVIFVRGSGAVAGPSSSHLPHSDVTRFITTIRFIVAAAGPSL